MSEVASFEAGRLAANARLYKYDPVLDRAADLYESDREAWHRLPLVLRDQSNIQLDLRRYYRAAVEAGVIPEGQS